MSTSNAILEAIANRASVRAYQERAVPREAVETVLRAAMAAPSSKNVQPWCFLVVEDRNALDAIAGAMPNARVLAGAPMAIMVGADLDVAADNDIWVQDCSAAAQNLLLAADAVGLGAVWLGVRPYPERIGHVRETLKLPERIAPLCLVAMGYPEKPGMPRDKYDPGKIHWGEIGRNA